MQVSLLVAASKNWVIGKDGKLPWHLPEDLKRFKALTLGKTVIMGHTTFRSLPFPNGLPKRKNIVLSRKAFVHPATAGGGMSSDGTSYFMVPDLSQALALCSGEEEVFIIGGAQIYSLALPTATKIYLTRLHQDYEGDTKLDERLLEGFEITGSEDHLGATIPYSFLNYERR